MELEFHLDLHDYKEYRKKVGNEFFKKHWFYYLLIFPLAAVLLFVAIVIGVIALDDAFSYESFFFGFWALLIFFVLKSILYANLTKPKNRNCFYEHQIFKTTKDGFKINSKTSFREFKWQHFIGFGETKNHFLVKHDLWFAEVIPKRAFKDEAQMEEFRKLCREKIPASA